MWVKGLWMGCVGVVWCVGGGAAPDKVDSNRTAPMSS